MPFLAAVLTCAPPAPEPSARRIVLITVDTLRADHIGAYGYTRPTTPFLDRLAQRMALFEDAVAQNGTTPQSLASLMTGRFPALDDVLVRNEPFVAMRPNLPNLAGWLRGHGFRTHGITSQIQTTSVTGLDRGFDSFDTVSLQPDGERYQRWTAAEVTDRAVGWIRANAEDPFFLWIHYFDPHWPYKPPASFTAHLDPLPAVESGPKEPYRFDEMRSDAYPLDAVDLREILEGYDNEIRYLDGEMERLFEVIEPLEDLLVVITADHGESLGEHRIVSHNDLYQSIIRVPLLIGGDTLPRGVRIADPVMLVDTAATVLDYAGAQPLPHTRGRSLRPLIEGGSLAVRTRLAEYHDGTRAVLAGGKKIIFRPDETEEVYDLERDPGELVRLENADLRANLIEAAKQPSLPPPGALGPEQLPEVTPEMIEELRAIGYVGD